MRRHILTTIAVLPLLLGPVQAEQNWRVDSPYGFSSEDSGKSAYLGVDIADITTDRLGALKLKEEQGVEVTMVDQDAPAGKAGVKEHDVILTMNGTVVESKSQLQRMIHETPPGRLITLGLSRDGQPMTIKVQLADRRSEINRWSSKDRGKDFDFHVEIPPIPNIPPINMQEFDMPNIGVVYVHSSIRSGLMVENLTPQLGEFFGAKGGNGVLVRSVERGSRGEKAGMRAGDVITRVGDQPVHDTSDFTHALRSRNGGSVTIAVIRDKKELTLTLSLPESKDSGEVIEEESFEAPEVSAATELALSKLQGEIAKLQPQIELTKQESLQAAEKLRKTACAQAKQMKEQAEKLKQEFGPKFQEQLEKERETLQKQMEELRLEFREDGLDL